MKNIKSPAHAGKKVNVPVDGEIEFNEQGIAKVSDECADILVTGSPDYEYADAKDKPKPAKKQIVEEDDDEEEEETTTDESEEEETEAEETDDEEESDGLDDLSKEQLVEIAVEAKYPEKEYKAFKNNKKNMLTYLRKKASK